MGLESALEIVAEYGDGDRFGGMKRHGDPVWTEEALAWSGTVTLRRRRLPAEQVLWLAIGMWLMRSAPIERVVDALELAMRVADSPDNRTAYGGQNTHRGESGYPSVPVVAMMALRSHVLSAFRFADCGTGETTLARDPERGPGEFAGDRGPELPGEKRSDSPRDEPKPAPAVTLQGQYEVAIQEKLGKDDYLVEWDVNEAGLPSTWTCGRSTTKRGFYASDASDLALYRERWDT